MTPTTLFCCRFFPKMFSNFLQTSPGHQGGPDVHRTFRISFVPKDSRMANDEPQTFLNANPQVVYDLAEDLKGCTLGGVTLGDPTGSNTKLVMHQVLGMAIGSYGKGFYVEGETSFKYKETLKKLCGKWNGKLKCWILFGHKKSELELWISSLVPAEVKPPPPIEWTEEQKKIFSFFFEGKGHGYISAVAGSGKTTTLIEAIRRYAEAHKGARFFFTTFATKNIADTKKKLEDLGLEPGQVECRSLHSAGLSYFLSERIVEVGGKNKGGHKAGTGSEWNLLAGLNRMPSNHLKKKNDLAETMPDLSSKERCALVKTACVAQEQLLINLVDGDEVFDLVGGGLASDLELQEKIRMLLPGFLNLCAGNDTVDFQDMIWAPHFCDLEPTVVLQFDFVIIDEFQDLNPAQVELVKRMVSSVKDRSPRVVIVGDPKQSIYGFRGAKNALSLFEAAFTPSYQGTLTFTQRCPTSHVQLACQMNPLIKAAPASAKGTLGFCDQETFESEVEKGCFVLSRWNKTLIKVCFHLVRQGKLCAIVGENDIIKGMLGMIEDFQVRYPTATKTMKEFLVDLNEREVALAIKREAWHRLLLINDFYETFLWLLEKSQNLDELTNFIKSVFVTNETDYQQEDKINFTSVHRAKGREAKTVYILSPSQFLSPPNQRPEYFDNDEAFEEEKNLLYVALTRSLGCLTFVQRDEDDVFNERFGLNFGEL